MQDDPISTTRRTLMTGAVGLAALAGLAELGAAGTARATDYGDLTDLEITRAIAFMSSGGRAADPSKPYSQTATVEGDVLVNTHCVKCHGVGLDGAPRLHEFADWKPRVGRGIDALVHSAVSGHNKMPSRAGLPGLSDVDLRNAVTYMVVQSASAKPMPAK